MNHKTGKIITKNGKTGIILNDQLKTAPPNSKIVVRQPPSLCYESRERQGLHWKVKGDKFSKFVKNKRKK